MSRVAWWATFIALTIRDGALTICGSQVALTYIPDRVAAVNVAVLIPVVSAAIWVRRVVSIARSRRRHRQGDAS